MRYDDWRRTVEFVRNGQIWSTREKVYTALAEETDPADPRVPTRAWLTSKAGISVGAYNNHFGSKSRTRFVDEEPMLVAIVEAKEWSWAPYQNGVLDVAAEVKLNPRVLLEAVVRALAEWASDYGALASYSNARPPSTAVLIAGEAVLTLGGDADVAEDLLRAVVHRAADRKLDEGSLAVLNAVRPTIDAAVGGHLSAQEDQSAAVVEVLSEYAQQLLARDTAAPAATGEVRELLDRLRVLIEEQP